MSADHSQEYAVTLLQDLGLKEYEARCFVALTRVPTAKAREIGEVADVPRTRVYDAVEHLSKFGLVETQHASPKKFRAISIEEALEVLRGRYEQKFTELGNTLESIDSVRESESNPEPPGVWTLSGIGTITARAQELIQEGDEEVVYLIGDESVLAEDVLDQLVAASDRGLPIYVGTASEEIFERIDAAVPGVQRFESWIEWLWTPREPGEAWTLGQILVVDRHGMLVSAHRETSHGASEDSAVWTTGVGNGLGMVAERLLSASIERLDETEGENEDDSDAKQEATS